MKEQDTISSLYENILKNFLYTFVYFPSTNWQNAFSPTINFGYNVDDLGVERHVLNEVGSYGKQLNRVMDVLTVLVARLDREKLTTQECRFVERFEDLARRADAAAAAYQGELPNTITHADINHLIDRMRSLKEVDQQQYGDLLKRLYESLPPPDNS